MKLIRKVDFFNDIEGYSDLVSECKNKHFEKVFYEVDLLAQKPTLDVIVREKDSNVWHEWDKCSKATNNIWLSRDKEGNFPKEQRKELGLDLVKYAKATVYAENIDGTLLHVGQMLSREYKPFKAVYKISSLTKALKTLEVEGCEDIIRLFKNDLIRPEVELVITIPNKGYDIKEVGIEYRWVHKSMWDAAAILINVGMISSKMYDTLARTDLNMAMHTSHLKATFVKGKLTASKIYFVPNEED